MSQHGLALVAPPWWPLPTNGLTSGNHLVIEECAEALGEHYDVTVFTVGRRRREEIGGVTMRFEPLWNREKAIMRRLCALAHRDYRDTAAYFASYVWRAMRQARRDGIDTVLLFQPVQWLPWARLLLPDAVVGLFCSSHHLFSAADYQGYGGLGDRLARRCMDAADAVLACSAFVRDRVVTRFPAHAARCHVVPQGVSAAFAPGRSSSRGGDERWRVLFVGRLAPEKGVEVLLHAFRTVHQAVPEAVLTLAGEALFPAGDGPTYERRLRDLAHELGIDSRVEFLGWVNRSDVPALYRAADVCVHPATWDEPFASVPLEAMAAGVPLVATPAGGTPELVRQGETGRLVPAGDAAALALALVACRADPVGTAAMAERGRRLVAEEYSWRRFAGRVHTVLEASRTGR